MTTKKHRAPSRKRYEERNPVLAFRVTAGEKARIEAEAAAKGLSLGEFLRQGQGLSGAEPPPASSESRVVEDLRRLEIQAILETNLRRITGPDWEDVDYIDYHAVIGQIRYLQAKTMTMPLKELERALSKVLARFEAVLGIPAREKTIAALEACQGELGSSVESLEARKAELETENTELAAANAELKAQLDDVARRTGMPRREVLEWLRKFEDLRRLVPQVSSRLSQLNYECQQTEATRFQIQKQAEELSAYLQSLDGIKEETFAGILERFGEREAWNLVYAILAKRRRQTEQEIWQMFADEAKSLMTAVPAQPYPVIRGS